MAESSKRKRKRKRVWVFSFLFLIGVGVLWFLPTFIAKSTFRDSVLNAIASAPQYELASRSASFGWFSPLVVDDLVITKLDQSSTLKIEKLSAEKSWFGLWLSSPELGSFTISRPQLDVIVVTDSNAEEEADSSSHPFPTLTAIIRDAHVVVRNEHDDQPEIDVDHIDLTTHFENEGSVSFLRVEPIQIFERLALTREQSNSGLQLIAPVLENEINIEGSMSLELTKIRLPLGTHQDEFAKLAEVDGIFRLHELSAGINNEMTKRLANMFAELLKLDELPDEWKLTEEAMVSFEVRDGRVFHDGLAIILPDISPGFSIRTRGLVSINEQIDIIATIELPIALLGEHDLARKISQTPIEIQITGTMPGLKFGLPADPSWVVELSESLLSNSLTPDEKELADEMLEFISELHKESGDQTGKLLPRLLARIQKLR